jgi:hypothetical protein
MSVVQTQMLQHGREVLALLDMPFEQMNSANNFKGRGSGPACQTFFSIGELAERWRCSRGTVYNRLRAVGAKVLDFGASGKKSKKAVPVNVVLEIENQRTRRLC